MTSSYHSDWQCIADYFPRLTPTQTKQFARLGELYHHWNEKINLISRKDIHNLYPHHILHSLSIAKVINFNPGATILDLGTGGGFPGIPLAILYPETKFLLVDSIGKKIKAVQAIANQINLTNVTTQHERAEKLTGTFDFIISRAVAKLPTIYHWCQNKIKEKNQHPIPNGILYLRGTLPPEGLEDLPVAYKSYRIQEFFPLPFFATKQVLHLYST